MKIYVLVSIISLFYGVQHVSGLSQPDPSTCKQSGCANTCQAENKSCCYCDDTQTYSLRACFCCPVNYSCCPSNLWGASPRCCPNGYTCTKSGGCTAVVNIPATNSFGIASKCRKDFYVYVTADNTCSMNIDGKDIYLPHANTWEVADKILVPGNASVITICACNELYKAGLLIYSPDYPDLFQPDHFLCKGSPDQCTAYWKDPTSSMSGWYSPKTDEKNDALSSRTVIVTGFPESWYFIWSNNPGNLLTSDWDHCSTFRINISDY